MSTVAKQVDASAAPFPNLPSTSTISVSQPDLEGRSSLFSGKGRDHKSKLPAGVIIGIFALLLLGVAGAGGHYYYSNSMMPTKAPSVPRASLVKSGSKTSSRAISSALSTSSRTGAVMASHPTGAQSVLSKHSRLVATAVLAVILAIALIVTIVMLVKMMNTPPQVIEKDIHDHPSSSSSESKGSGLSPSAIGAIVAAVILLVTTLLGFGFAYKSRQSAAEAQKAQGAIQTQLNTATGAQTQLETQLLETRVQLAAQRGQTQLGLARFLEALKKPDCMRTYRSTNAGVLKKHIRDFFDCIVTLVSFAQDGNEDLATRTEGPEDQRNLRITNLESYLTEEVDCNYYFRMTEGGKSSVAYFANMIKFRGTFPEGHPLKTRGFVLFVKSRDDRASVPRPDMDLDPNDGWYFVAVTLDDLSDNLKGLGIVLDQLLKYKVAIRELFTSDCRIPLLAQDPGGNA